MTSKKPMFRLFNPSPVKEDPVERRRAQLRSARSTYRERKTQYIKALEKDLGSSRRREAHQARESEDLSNTVYGLLQLLAQHNIVVPDDLRFGPPPEAVARTLVRRRTVSMFSELSQGTTYAGSLPDDDGKAGFVEEEWPDYVPSRPPPPPKTRVCDLDSVTLGIQFVIRIEEPCLQHLHGEAGPVSEPSGHSLTVTSQILRAASVNIAESAAAVPYEDAHAVFLARLLAAAPDIARHGEITPVQAWNDLKSRPLFGGLDVKNLMHLADTLRDAVKCHGFGAVIEYQTFQNIVRELLIFQSAF